MQEGIVSGICLAIFAFTTSLAIFMVCSTLRANYILKTRMGDSRAYTIFVSAITIISVIVFPLTLMFMLGFLFWLLGDAKATGVLLILSSLLFTMVAWMFSSFRKDLRRELGHGEPEIIVQDKRQGG